MAKVWLLLGGFVAAALLIVFWVRTPPEPGPEDERIRWEPTPASGSHAPQAHGPTVTVQREAVPGNKETVGNGEPGEAPRRLAGDEVDPEKNAPIELIEKRNSEEAEIRRL